MPQPQRLQLTGGAYQARSVIAAAQSQINLYAEPMPQQQGEPAAFAYYPTPGLRLLGVAPTAPFRGAISCSNGKTFVVYGTTIYDMSSSGVLTFMAASLSTSTLPVSMAENGTDVMITELGVAAGNYTSIHLATNAVFSNFDANYLGADHVDYLDTFFVSNVPNAPTLQVSNSLSLTWNPLYQANKAGHWDNLMGVIVAKREIWLVGTTTTEVWYNTGASDFPFAAQPGVIIDHGCIARYSIAEMDNNVFWLSQDRRGIGIVLQGSGYTANRISTYALESEFATYTLASDAEGYTFQYMGHQFYVLSFPTADKTWVYDTGTKLWYQWVFTTTVGGPRHRHKARQIFPAFGALFAGDTATGGLYAVEAQTYLDDVYPIIRQRAFPHLLNDGNRQFYWELVADMDCGNAPGGATLSLDWSDDRGHTFGTPLTLNMGTTGAYNTSLQFQRLGMARDRVFRLTWSDPVPTALQSAWIIVEPSES